MRLLYRGAAVSIVFFSMLVLGCGPQISNDMVLVPAGSFVMGTDEVQLETVAEESGITKPWVLDAAPAHRVNLPSFFIDRYEVTNGAYLRFVEATGFSILPHWRTGRPDPDQERKPVIFVNWQEADAYCRWLGKRLPTEAEWEKAARGPYGWIYPWGYFFDYRRANVGGLQSGPSPVGSFPRGRTPYGADDMIGNVWEWTADWYHNYPGAMYTSPDFGEKYRVARGNSWAGLGHFPKKALDEIKAVEARAAYRLYFPPHIALEDVGFRCAKDLPMESSGPDAKP
ncbi:MAG: formylglycine-generating enzyme family protein [Nitrospirae bacterium]|nr:formylglycine-generating enzyme family protein [Nitrospirota bacterium]